MPKKLLESAFIELLDINSDEFQQRKYFFYRWATFIEKEIGLKRGKELVTLITFENQIASLPELAIKIKAVYVGNIYSLIEGDIKEYQFYKNILRDEPWSLRFSELISQVMINRDETLCTIVYESIELNDFNQPVVDEDHIPAITSYIKYRILEKERMLCAIKGGGNYYQLRSETEEQRKDYSLAIINARSNERFREAEKVIEINTVINKNEDLTYIVHTHLDTNGNGLNDDDE